MLTVVIFKWQDRHHGYVPKFTARHVNAMANMVDAYHQDPHRIVCFTDDATGVDPRIQCLPLWDDYAHVPNPTGGGRPSCYRRLKLWAPEMTALIGPRFVHLDLDAVVCGDLRPLWNRYEDVVMWTDPQGRWPYMGGTYMADTGARPEVWTEFDPVTSPRLAAAKGYQGSDQAWLSYRLGKEAFWTHADGIYRQLPRQFAEKPRNARIVFTTGIRPPWDADVGWIKDHWHDYADHADV